VFVVALTFTYSTWPNGVWDPLGPGSVAAQTGGADALATDFGSEGVWQYTSGSWSSLSGWDPDIVVSWNDQLAAGFGSGRGLWSHDGTAWTMRTTWSPYDMIAWSEDLVAAFDNGRGLWLNTSGAWSQIAQWEPVQMAPNGDSLIASFGVGRGLWIRDAGSWSVLTSWHPDDFIVWQNNIVATFSASRGLWMHNGISWRQLTHLEASHLATFSDGLAVSFGEGVGLWLYDGTFSELTSWQPYAVVGRGDKLVAAFDAGRGLWLYSSAVGWRQLTEWEPIHLEPWGDRFAIDFGHGRGLWLYEETSGWENLSSWNSERIETIGEDNRGAHDGLGVAADVTGNLYCQDVRYWNPQWRALEEEILQIVNQRRSEGANCGSEGVFGPATPLAMQPALRCAARVHSKDMVDRDFFSHTNPSGESPWDRFVNAGYSFSWAGENIAAGNSTPEATMAQWMSSDGHCANIMNSAFNDIGVGYYPGGSYGFYWTQGLASQ
jgi:uncharacterized protein YkwD